MRCTCLEVLVTAAQRCKDLLGVGSLHLPQILLNRLQL
jgi:hypothetical protein